MPGPPPGVAQSVTRSHSRTIGTIQLDYGSQGDPSQPSLGQFPQSFLDAISADLQASFKDTTDTTSVSANAAKRPADVSGEGGDKYLLVLKRGGTIPPAKNEALPVLPTKK